MTIRMRQSLINSAETCLRRAAYSIEGGRPYQTGEARAIGTAYHKSLEVYYDMRKEHGFHKPDTDEMFVLQAHAYDEFDAEVFKAGQTWLWETDKQTCYDKIEKMLLAYFNRDYYWPEGYEVLGTEESFTSAWLPGVDAHGTVDLILRDPHGWMVLVDHKTAGRRWPVGKEDPRKNIQAPWYTYWAKRLDGGDKFYFAFDVMTYKGDFERRAVFPTPGQEDLVIRKAQFYAKVLGTLTPEDIAGNTSTALCSERYCDYWDICPFGAGQPALVSG